MCFHKKPKGEKVNDKAVLGDAEIIADNVKALRIAAVKLAGSDYSNKITELADSYQYVSPKESGETKSKDKKIGDRIGDIECAIVKAVRTKDYSEIDDLIQKIKVLVAER